jgi:DNA-binding MarR family transcriptional regulator
MPARSGFLGPEERLFQSVLRTADHLLRGEIEVLRLVDLTFSQYNVLRILRGAGETGLACREVGERLVTRDPDVTRLLDRMETQGLSARARDSVDRRIVTTRITATGRELLARLDEPVAELHSRQLGHLGPTKLRKLLELLEEARAF